MDHALAPAPLDGRAALAAVRAWWQVHHPPPTVAQRLDLAYTVVFVGGMYALLGYGATSSALAKVLTPRVLAADGPPVATGPA